MIIEGYSKYLQPEASKEELVEFLKSQRISKNNPSLGQSKAVPTEAEGLESLQNILREAVLEKNFGVKVGGLRVFGAPPDLAGKLSQQEKALDQAEAMIEMLGYASGKHIDTGGKSLTELSKILGRELEGQDITFSQNEPYEKINLKAFLAKIKDTLIGLFATSNYKRTQSIKEAVRVCVALNKHPVRESEHNPFSDLIHNSLIVGAEIEAATGAIERINKITIPRDGDSVLSILNVIRKSNQVAAQRAQERPHL